MAPLRAAVAAVASLAALALRAAAEAPTEHCDVAVVGAGAGGAYVAWRSAFAGKAVCVFELMARPGGRIHSLRAQGPAKDLTVEAGAYRFAPKPIVHKMGNITWNVDTPLTAAIVSELGLPTKVYNPDPSMWDHGMHKIVDQSGNDAGYLTMVETMLANATAHGAKVHFRTRVVGLDAAEGGDGPVTLRFACGREVTAGAVVLNLPQAPLLELLRNSSAPFSTSVPRPLYSVVSYPIMKLYVHYDDAWWRNELNLTAGPFQNAEPSNIDYQSIYMGIPPQSPAPLEGQYHDGHVRCDGPGGKCRGYLQAYYGNDKNANGGVQGAIKYFSLFHRSVSDDSVVHLSPDAADQRVLLEEVHEALVGFHKAKLDAVGATARVASLRPTGGVLSIWSQGVAGIHGGCHSPMPGNNPKPDDVPEAALAPFPDGTPVYVANEAYGHMHCWAESSLAMADSAVRKKLGIQAPGTPAAELLSQAAGKNLPPTDPFFLPGAHAAQPAPAAGGPEDSLLLAV